MSDFQMEEDQIPDVEADERIHMHFYVFRANRGKDAEPTALYVAEPKPLQQEWRVHKDSLSGLAKILVRRQLKFIRDSGVDGEECFPHSFTFEPPYDVMMQRHHFWNTESMTPEEIKEFLHQMKTHYLDECDSIQHEQEFPRDCILY